MSASEMSIGMIEQVAGKGAARAARRRRGMDGGVRRPGWVTYALLAVIVLVSAFPLYYAFLLSSSTSSSPRSATRAGASNRRRPRCSSRPSTPTSPSSSAQRGSC